jgi:two-component system cell cycle response regulator DivK
MSLPDGEERPDQRKPGYVHRHAIPPDLQTAVDIAFSSLPTYSPPRDPKDSSGPIDPTVMRKLALAVASFVAGLKREGEPPQNVLIALKTVLRRQTRSASLDYGVFEELQRLIILSAVKAYFAEIDPQAVPDHVVNPPDLAEEIHAGAAPASQRRRPLVFVVDDDEDARAIQREFLTSFGFEVVVAEDGREVMNMARRLRPAVVLLDIAMPHMEGTELVQLLKADPATKHIPVVAVTGVQTLTESPDLVSIGFDDVVLKPVRRDEFLRTVVARVGT